MFNEGVNLFKPENIKDNELQHAVNCRYKNGLIEYQNYEIPEPQKKVDFYNRTYKIDSAGIKYSTKDDNDYYLAGLPRPILKCRWDVSNNPSNCAVLQQYKTLFYSDFYNKIFEAIPDSQLEKHYFIGATFSNKYGESGMTIIKVPFPSLHFFLDFGAIKYYLKNDFFKNIEKINIYIKFNYSTSFLKLNEFDLQYYQNEYKDKGNNVLSELPEEFKEEQLWTIEPGSTCFEATNMVYYHFNLLYYSGLFSYDNEKVPKNWFISNRQSKEQPQLVTESETYIAKENVSTKKIEKQYENYLDDITEDETFDARFFIDKMTLEDKASVYFDLGETVTFGLHHDKKNGAYRKREFYFNTSISKDGGKLLSNMKQHWVSFLGGDNDFTEGGELLIQDDFTCSYVSVFKIKYNDGLEKVVGNKQFISGKTAAAHYLFCHPEEHEEETQEKLKSKINQNDVDSFILEIYAQTPDSSFYYKVTKTIIKYENDNWKFYVDKGYIAQGVDNNITKGGLFSETEDSIDKKTIRKVSSNKFDLEMNHFVFGTGKYPIMNEHNDSKWIVTLENSQDIVYNNIKEKESYNIEDIFNSSQLPISLINEVQEGDVYGDKENDSWGAIAQILLNDKFYYYNLNWIDDWNYIETFRSRLWIANDNELWYSLANYSETFDLLNYYRFDSNITGLIALQEWLYIFTEHKVHAIKGADRTTFVMKEFFNHGCVKDTAQKWENQIFFVSQAKDNMNNYSPFAIYRIYQYNIQRVSQKIDDIFKNIEASNIQYSNFKYMNTHDPQDDFYIIELDESGVSCDVLYRWIGSDIYKDNIKSVSGLYSPSFYITHIAYNVREQSFWFGNMNIGQWFFKTKEMILDDITKPVQARTIYLLFQGKAYFYAIKDRNITITSKEFSDGLPYVKGKAGSNDNYRPIHNNNRHPMNTKISGRRFFSLSFMFAANKNTFFEYLTLHKNETRASKTQPLTGDELYGKR